MKNKKKILKISKKVLLVCISILLVLLSIEYTKLNQLEKVQAKESSAGNYSQGGADLSGAIYKYSYYDVEKGNSINGLKPVRTWYFETKYDEEIDEFNIRPDFDSVYNDNNFNSDELYKSNKGTTVFPIGTYTIQEVKAPKGYLIDDKVYKVYITGDEKNGFAPIDEDGNWIEAINTYNNGLAFNSLEQVARGNFTFTKQTDNGEPLKNCVFLATNEDTNETHLVVTDENGEFNSQNLINDNNTNKNDEALTWKSDQKPVIVNGQYNNEGHKKDKIVVNEKLLNSSYGVWFSHDTENNDSEPNNDVASFLFGTYKFKELKCKANEGLSLIKFEGSVFTNDRIKNTDEIYNLGIKTDSFVYLNTSATNNKTGGKELLKSTESEIKDEISYEGLVKDTEYRVVTTLHKKSANGGDGGIVVDKEGNPVKSETTFTAEDKKGKVETIIKLDTTSYQGQELVVFETIYDENDDIAYHDDIGDDSQTVYVKKPIIKTQVVSKDTGTNTTPESDKAKFIDTIFYEGLVKDKEYTVITKIYNKATNNIGETISGKPYIFENSFVADDTDGQTDIDITANIVGQGRLTNLVFFEELYEDKDLDNPIATHKDINDEKQTIIVSEIKITTEAVDYFTKNKTLERQGGYAITDIVKYDNAIKSRTYTLKGEVFDKETGESTGIVTDKTFVADKYSGEVKMNFAFDNNKYLGKELVVFEKLYEHNDSHYQSDFPKESLVAEEGNVNKKAQTVKVGEDEIAQTIIKTHNKIDWIFVLLGVMAVLCIVSIIMDSSIPQKIKNRITK